MKIEISLVQEAAAATARSMFEVAAMPHARASPDVSGSRGARFPAAPSQSCNFTVPTHSFYTMLLRRSTSTGSQAKERAIGWTASHRTQQPYCDIAEPCTELGTEARNYPAVNERMSSTAPQSTFHMKYRNVHTYGAHNPPARPSVSVADVHTLYRSNENTESKGERRPRPPVRRRYSTSNNTTLFTT